MAGIIYSKQVHLFEISSKKQPENPTLTSEGLPLRLKNRDSNHLMGSRPNVLLWNGGV
jgi:hypothetical protein